MTYHFEDDLASMHFVCKLTGYYDCPAKKIVYSVNHIGHEWWVLFEEFRQFLVACGYEVPIGEWVSTDEDEENQSSGEQDGEEEPPGIF